MDGSERTRLVEDHLELARRAAAMIFPRVRQHVELDELVALGNMGLAEAAARYDPARGASFSTFAWYRVQGSIMDGLRRNTQLPRRVWAKLVALRAASAYLEHQGERDAGAAAGGIAPAAKADALAAIQKAMSAIRTMYVTSLDGLRDAGFEPASGAPGITEQLDLGRLSSRLREALEQLPERERALLTKHYWEGKNLLEAGEELGISKSWASRLHAQAVDRLRAIVDDS
ncbi:MAG: polymerase sigma factor for flagellar operon [Deltaproteobacteria bacterium]|nr:polymerase sigma factor for flagellar operon [Deltaproteobacteria bacterium]